MAKNAFEQWLDTFLEEKKLSNKLFKIEYHGTLHLFESEQVLNLIRKAPANEQAGFKRMVVKIDFLNGEVNDFLEHLAKGYIALTFQ